MSGIGKSHWARWLKANHDYEWLDCDGLIEKKLKAEGVLFDAAGTLGLSHWMGQPYDPHYPKASRTYIEHEREAMQAVIARLRKAPDDVDMVVDTTGSVIYAGDDILEDLKVLTRVYYLEASQAHTAELFARDRTDPKPLSWDTIYQPHPGEKPEDARKRCFPALIESRAQRYAKMAHVTVPFEHHKHLDSHFTELFGSGG
jgi:shikimate kinase